MIFPRKADLHASCLIAGLSACIALAGCARDGLHPRAATPPAASAGASPQESSSRNGSGGGVPEAASFKPAQPTTAPAAAMPPAEAPAVVEIDPATRDAIGAAAMKRIRDRYPPATDPKLDEYLLLVGSLLTLDAPGDQGEYQYIVLETDRPLSLAAAPRTIALSRGLIATMVDESELAGVLAREMANLRADRTLAAIGLKVRKSQGQSDVKVDAYSARLAEALLSPALPPDVEESADLEGARVAAAAKYAPDGYLRVLARLHPDAAPGSAAWERLRTLDANVSIVAKAHPAADVRLPARFEAYVKPRK